MIHRLSQRLRADQRGATIVEFALVVPVMFLMFMGFGELAYEAYVKSVLTGAIQKAGRDSTIQGAAAKALTLDDSVLAQVQNVAPAAAYVSTPTRKSYENFGYISPEPFTDSNGNGIRDPSECYTDINGNSAWDADPGSSGQGGANDAVVYTATITYPRIFPLFGMIGWSQNATITDSTVLKNQPYASRSASTPATVCK